jgi:hypothetical protein
MQSTISNSILQNVPFNHYVIKHLDDAWKTLQSWDRYGDIVEVKYKHYIYPFRSNCRIKGHPQSRVVGGVTRYVYHVPVFATIIGEDAENINESRENWHEKFHQTFQSVYYKLNWERNRDERMLFDLFNEIVDIQRHLEHTPVEHSQIGEIVEIGDDFYVIKWINEQRETIKFVDCLQEMKCNEYFIAKHLRDYQTGKLLKICEIMPTSYKDWSVDEMNEWYKSIPVAKLPPSKF